MAPFSDFFQTHKAHWLRAYRDWQTIPKDGWAESLKTGKTHCRYLLCQYQSPIPSKLSNKNRLHNLKKACAQFEGVLIKPGQLFSFYHLLGRPDSHKGFKSGPHFDGLILQDNLQSGLGQLASVLFHLALLADFQLIEHHSATVNPKTFQHDYVPLGLEACVNWPTQDLRFRSSFPFDVAIQTQMNGSEIVCTLFGNEAKHFSAVLECQIVDEKPFSTKLVPMGRMPRQKGKIINPGCKGYRIQVLRKLLQNNQVSEEKLLLQVDYEPVPQLVIGDGTESQS